MAPRNTENLVLELQDTNIPCDPCPLPCIDKHFLVCRPKDYNRRTKKLKHGAKILLFTIKADQPKAFERAVIKDAKEYQFTK
jgi:hypothetical protein